MAMATLFNRLPACVAILGWLVAWLVGAQAQTVYLTQTQTIYTSCDCPGAILSPLSVSLPCPDQTGLTWILTGPSRSCLYRLP